MAYYSYKELCYRIPSHIEERFQEEAGREPDGDPNYNGDCWSLAAMWVEELESGISQRDNEIKKLKDTIKELEFLASKASNVAYNLGQSHKQWPSISETLVELHSVRMKALGLCSE